MTFNSYKFEFSENFVGFRTFGRQQRLNEWRQSRPIILKFTLSTVITRASSCKFCKIQTTYRWVMAQTDIFQMKYGDVTIFKMAVVRHRGFSNFENFHIWQLLLSDSTSSYLLLTSWLVTLEMSPFTAVQNASHPLTEVAVVAKL